MFYIKKFLVKLALSLIKGINFISRQLANIFKFIGNFIFILYDWLVRYVLLPIYKVLHYSKRKVLNIYSPARSRIFLFFTKKYIAHALIIILSFAIVFNNLSAQEAREENFITNTIANTLFSENTESEIVIEKPIYYPQEKIFSYLDKSTQVENIKLAEMPIVTENQLAEEIATLIDSGSAIVKPNITEIEIPKTTRTKKIIHTIVEGDTLSTIAEKYGISVNTLLWANNLTLKSVLKPGNSLIILPVTGVSHIVKKGETLAAISKKYGVEAHKIQEFNGLNDNGTLIVGEEIIIPNGVMPQIVVPKNPIYASSKPTVDINKLFTTPSSEKISTIVKGSASGYGTMHWPTSWRVITQYYKPNHHGLDIGGNLQSPIYAAEAGVVEWAGWKTGYGNCYIINHGNGVKTLYAHLSKYIAQQGQQVARGETIGIMGSTGWSTGPHLHFEVQINGQKLNPLNYIK